MKHGQLRKYIIQPVLKDIGLYSRDAEELLVLTASTESLMGEYIRQVNGPARGIYQMEPRTHDDIWINFLNYKPELSTRVRKWDLEASFPYSTYDQMMGNHYYATAMARVFYLRFNEKLPNYKDVEGLARYWKKYWNTKLGAGTIEQAISNYNTYVNG